MLARIQSLLPIGFPGENNVFRHGEVVMFQKRVAKMRLHVLQPVLFHNGNQPSIVSVTIADVALPTLVYAVPSGGASRIQFPVIGIGNYIHALLTGQRILPACLVVLLNLLKLGVGKADNRFWRPCSLDTVAGGTFSCGQKQPAQNQPLNMPNIANKSRARTISTGNVPYFTAHLFEFPKMCSMYEGMRNSSRGKIIVGKDIVNVRWGSSVTSVENANVQQPTAPQGVVEEADDGITLMDLFKIIRKHLVTAIIAFVVVVAGVSAYTFLAPAKYTATAQTMATYNASQNGVDINQQSAGGSYISNQITSYPTLATTSKVLKPVIDDLGLDETVTDLAGQVTVTNPTNTAFVNIAVVDGDPKQAADIANSVAESLKNVIESDLYSGDKSPVKLSIVQKAQVPTSKSSPKNALYLAVGVVLGIIIGVFAALIKDLLNTKVEETSDVRGIVRASSLGSVPMDASLDDKRPVLVSQPNGAIAEEFRRIHTNIDFLQTDRTEGVGQLLVITSAQPSEGKTTMAINTAVALAEDGAKVLLIDADLRHPSVAHHLGIEGAAGLAHVLSGQMGPKDVVQSYWKPNLHILPGGKRPANAGVLLGSETMKLMVEQALTQYDYVIIDTAPLTVSNDGAVFGRWAKGLLLVVSRNVCEKKSLQEAADTLATAQVPVLGFIFNRADPKKTNTHSNYYYYYEDGAPRSSHRAKGKKRH